MLRKSLFLTSLLFALNSSGQSQMVFQSRAGFYLTPFSVIDFYNGPTILLGYEQPFYKRLFVFVEGGFSMPFLGDVFPEEWKDIKGYTGRLEFRYHYYHSPRQRMYLGLQGDFGRQSYIRTDEVASTDPKEADFMTTYPNNRRYKGAYLTWGIQVQKRKHLEFSFNTGFGLRYNQVSNSLDEDASRRRLLGDSTVPTTWIQKKGNNVVPRFLVNVKLGYRLDR